MAVRIAAGQYNGIKNVVPARDRGTRHMSQYTIIRSFPGQPGQFVIQGRQRSESLRAEIVAEESMTKRTIWGAG